MNTIQTLDGATAPTTAARGLQQHALSAAYPAMTAEEYEALKESIAAIGVQTPVTIYEGDVLDGWHRWLAALELGLPCPTAPLGDVDPFEFVRAANEHRRHLNKSQFAMVEVALTKWKSTGRPEKGAAAAPFSTVAQMAESAGVSERTIQLAKVVESDATPEVKEAVKAGKMSVEKGAATTKPPKPPKPPKDKPAPKAEKLPTPAQLEANANAAEAHGDVDLATLLDEKNAELLEAQELLAVAAADDLKAEAMKWRRISDVATRRQNELLGKLKVREEELKVHVNTIRRIGRAVGEGDPKKVAAAVEALARKLEAIA